MIKKNGQQRLEITRCSARKTQTQVGKIRIFVLKTKDVNSSYRSIPPFHYSTIPLFHSSWFGWNGTANKPTWTMNELIERHVQPVQSMFIPWIPVFHSNSNSIPTEPSPPTLELTSLLQTTFSVALVRTIRNLVHESSSNSLQTLEKIDLHEQFLLSAVSV